MVPRAVQHDSYAQRADSYGVWVGYAGRAPVYRSGKIGGEGVAIGHVGDVRLDRFEVFVLA